MTRFGCWLAPAAVVGAVLAAALPAAAQTPAAYRPVLGDLMTMTVQPRHIKLGIAGQEGNWPYAAYELHELEESFEHVAKLVPKYRNLSIPQTLAASVNDPMAALDRAIKAQDQGRFTAAYAQLTAGCNACHQSAERGVIVIRVPTSSPFPDQDFRPPQK